MKKVFYCTLVVAVISLFAACKKDGKYNPKEKIANVYKESMSIWAYSPDGEQWIADSNITPKHLSEQWTWDGKKLSQITYFEKVFVYNGEDDTYTEQTVEDVVKFTYDGSQLTEAKSEDERMVFTYDGKRLQKAELFDEGQTTPWIAFAFEHDGKKISRITVTENDIDWDVKDKPAVCRLEHLLFGSIMPDAKSVEKCVTAMRKKATKGSIISTIDFTWDGGNVSKMVVKQGSYTSTVTYTYDDKKNPFQGFVYILGGSGMSEDGFEFTNENNILKAVYQYPNEEDDVNNYTYTYDGKWPTSCTESYEWTGENNRTMSRSTLYFEYK